MWSKGDRPVRLVDLPVFGRPVRLWWRKRRWMCPDRTCEGGSFVEQDPSVAPERGLLTSRAGRWATVQVGRLGRTVQEVAVELGCDWHTVNNEVIRWGEALLEADTGGQCHHTAIHGTHPLIQKIFNMVHAWILGPNHQVDQRFISPL